jgi:hypothetical protein
MEDGMDKQKLSFFTASYYEEEKPLNSKKA